MMRGIDADAFELKRRLLLVIIFFCIACVVSFYFSNACFNVLLYPARRVMDGSFSFIMTHWSTTLWSPIYLALSSAALLTMPVCLFHLARFLTPGLYKKERRWFYFILFGGSFLFFLGLLFCYFCILPTVFRVCLWLLPQKVSFLPELLNTCQFILHFLILFGIIFELPLFWLSLLKYKKITSSQLTLIRPYVIVSSFILGMLLTPPDVIAQMMLALPLWGLYEVSLLMARFLLPFFD